MARTATDSLDRISFLLGRAYYAYVGFLEKVLEEKGMDQVIHPGMGHVLFALFEKDDRILKEIASRVQVSYSTLSGMLNRMERNGLIERHKDPNDGRAVRVRLTKRAKSLKPRCFQVAEVLNDVMTGDLTAAEAKAIQSGLKRMTSAMNRYSEKELAGVGGRNE